MSSDNTKEILGIAVTKDDQRWFDFKDRLDINIDHQLNQIITPKDIPQPMAYLAAEYALQRLYEHRKALDNSTIEAMSIEARFFDVLQNRGTEIKSLGPDELQQLSDREARQYAITVMEQIRTAQKEKKMVDERIAKKKKGEQTEEFESRTLFGKK